MKIFESENDQFGTFLNGLAYTLIVAILLVLGCIIINPDWFDKTLTYFIIGTICIVFFVSGLKKVKENKIGILKKYGRRDFKTVFSEGIWWISPFSYFREEEHFDVLQSHPGDPLSMKITTKDGIRLSIEVQYYWKIIDPNKYDKARKYIDLDDNEKKSYLSNKLKFDLGLHIKNNNALDIYCDMEISHKVMQEKLIKAADSIGILLIDIFPNIDWDESYNDVIRQNQADYERFKFELEKLTKLKTLENMDLTIFVDQINRLVNANSFSMEQALEFLKIYKNRVEVNETIYKIPGLEKVVDSIMNALKNKIK